MQRLITAAILIPIVLFILFFLTPQVFFGATTIVMLLALWEWTHLMGVTSKLLRLAIVLFTLPIFGYMVTVQIQNILYVGTAWWLFSIILLLVYPKFKILTQNKVSKWLIGLLVLIPSWAALNFIRNQSDGEYSILFFFILIWGADSVAYFVGRKWGKTKLAPTISPGKSWQGVAGALLFSIIFTLLAMKLAQVPNHLWTWGLIVSVLTIIFSIVGDLVESMLKREAGVKDSGSILPGHGGVLDRIDSLTAAAPIFAVSLLILQTYLT